MKLDKCLLLTILFTSGASRAAEPVAIMSMGTATCSQYASTYKQDPNLTDDAFMPWVHGFLSGMNMEALLKGNASRNLGAKSLQQIQTHIHFFCDRNPLKTVAQGALELYLTLPSVPHPKSLHSK